MALQDSRHPTLHEQAEERTTAPGAVRQAAHGLNDAHDHEHDHDQEHAFEWPEAVRIGLVALIACC
jgi:hypothetical protein